MHCSSRVLTRWLGPAATLVLSLFASTSAHAGRIFVTGHDPDYHASHPAEGGVGAQAMNRAVMSFLLDPGANPYSRAGIHEFLFVESRIPVPAGHSRGKDGIVASGFVEGVDFEHHDASTLAQEIALLGTKYAGLVVASDFGATLTQAELDVLDQYADAIASFVNSGGGLYVMSETNEGAGLTPDGGRYGFVPLLATSSFDNFGPFHLTAAGQSTGLGDLDLNEQQAHAFFSEWVGLEAAELDDAGRTISLMGTEMSRPNPRIAFVRDVPGDQGGEVTIAWDRSGFDVRPQQVITAYRVWRRAASGQQTARVDAPLTAPALGHGVGTLVAFRNLRTGAMEYWESLVTLPASYLAGYAFTAPTLRDSIAHGNPHSIGSPYTTFFVQALTADPFVFFSSAADSGFSTDDLPPGRPESFTGAYAAGATHLHWLPAPEQDLDGYRVYRGSSASFAPAAANLIAATPDTGYADMGALGSYYKLATIDVHGNESAPRLLAPGATLGVVGGSSGLWLARPAPNPVRGARLVLRFSLPSWDAAIVEALDVSGQRIWSQDAAGLGPGVHTLILPSLRPGLYWLRVRQVGDSVTEKVVVLP
jgi:hypothetical protein